MLIQSLKLENIKSYKKETIEFKEGINGISGLNGHGKTTILESIGHVLFDSLPYSTKDFVRRGEKTGKITLKITDSDGIEYRIVRKVGASTGYWIERDGLPNIESKVDVQAFIMDTFFPYVGGADLKSVFENAVGVAQGTFATSFSQTSGIRKSTFDKILRVDEYKDAFDGLLPCANAVKDEKNEIEKGISVLEGGIESYETKTADRDMLHNGLLNMKSAISATASKHSELGKQKDEMAAIIEAMQKLDSELSSKNAELKGIESSIVQKKKDLESAQKSRDIVDATRKERKEYEQTKKDLAELEKKREDMDKIRERVESMKREIVKLSKDVGRIEEINGDISRFDTQIRELAPKVAQQKQIVQDQEEIRQKVQKLNTDISTKGAELNGINAAIKTAAVEVESARKALQVVEDTKKEREEYEKIRDSIAALEEKRSQMDVINKMIESMKLEIATLSKDSERFLEAEKKIAQIDHAISELTPKVDEQQRIRHEIDEIKGQHAIVQSAMGDAKKRSKMIGESNLCPVLNDVKCQSVTDFSAYFEGELATLSEQGRTIQANLKELDAQLKQLNDPEGRIKELHANRKSNQEVLENDIIKAAPARLSEMQASVEAQVRLLEGFGDAKTQLDEAKKRLAELQDAYQKNVGQQAVAAKYDLLNAGLGDLIGSEAVCAKALGAISKELEESEKPGSRLDILNAKLVELNDPEGEVRKLEATKGQSLKELAKLAEVPVKLADVQGKADVQIGLLEGFGDVKQQIVDSNNRLLQLSDAYQKNVENQKLAQTCDGVAQELERILDGRSQIGEQISSIEKELAAYREAGKGEDKGKDRFGKEAFETIVAKYEESGKMLGELQGKYTSGQERLESLSKEVGVMEAKKAQIVAKKKELDRQERLLQFVDFTRKTLKNSAQLIVTELISSVADAANIIYCDIMDDHSQELIWTQDYEIRVIDNGEEKSFKQLSGGEQMSCALAVRIALLKSLSDCDFIFLDEPTQNMDELRRENLAEQLQNVRGFRQMFVISHDDTFTASHANVIKVEKMGGVSAVVG